MIHFHWDNSTECVKDFDKLHLVKLGKGGSVLSLGQSLATAPGLEFTKLLKANS